MPKLTKAVSADLATQQAVASAQLQAARQDQVGGKSTIKIDEMLDMKLPTDWDVSQPLGNVIMAEFADENKFGEVLRDGIWLKQEITNRMWRVAKILKCGPECAPYLKPGLMIMFPSDRGLPIISFYGQKLIFLNEERIFAIVERRQQKKEIDEPSKIRK